MGDGRMGWFDKHVYVVGWKFCCWRFLLEIKTPIGEKEGLLTFSRDVSG
jgi:hypothetical protein